MTEAERSMEERILQAVKLTLAGVIRDTATPQGMRHPLSDGTIEDLAAVPGADQRARARTRAGRGNVR